jgi:hypothetical protein
MSLTALGTRRYGSRLPVHALGSRSLLLALALLAACSKGAQRPVAPLEELHFPAWVALHDGQLLVVNDDQDLAFLGGSIVSLDRTANTFGGGAPVPYMAGKVHLVEPAASAGCDLATGPTGLPVTAPFAMVPGRSEEALFLAGLPLGPGAVANRIDITAPSAANPFDVALTCGADRRARAWVSYQRGLNSQGYVGQLDFSGTYPPSVVPVFVGLGEPRSFAWDPAHDRLYFSNREHAAHAPLRWIQIGQGCKNFDGGIQDESQGGCHVEQVGYDLSAHTAGAEPNAIVLSSGERPCTAGGFVGNCRRMYLSVRMYDADLARVTNQRPSTDLGGKLVVLELPEAGLGGPAPQWIADFDIGKIAGEVLVIPRPGLADLVVATAADDGLVWIYDDQAGAMVKVFGRLASGLPELGHMPSGLASEDLGNGKVRVYVTSYQDHWVSAIDVPLANPGGACAVRNNPTPGGDPCDPTKPYLRLGVTP